MSKRPRGSIHKIREFNLEKINLVDEFDILQIVGEGWFGKILLVEHRATQTEMVLKAVPKPYVTLRDFYREFHYGLHLGIHRNIVTTYDVAFETAGFYVFTQEYAPLGDLTSNIGETGVGEIYSKRVAKQIAAAIDYMHTKDIVHRDVKLDNVLIYRSDFTRVKLCDFGESYQNGTIVERRNEWLPYSPPEVLEIRPEGTYKADPSHDVWQFGIVIFVCLTGCLPWQKAATDDPRYVRYTTWANSIISIRRTPKLFKLLSSRAQRLFRRFLEPRVDRRPKNLTDLAKFLDDRWLAKTAEKEMAEYETDELCPSMYSFHSSPDEKHRLLYTLADCGIETNVDRQMKKNRIKDWIESSVITEEDEEENDECNSTSPSSSITREPVAGHISSIRTEVQNPKEIKTTLKDANQKHFDPRTGVLQQGPSEMGVTSAGKPASSSINTISTMNNGDSLGSSLIALGSRHEMINSSLEMFTSDMEIHHLGMNVNEYHHTLSSANLLLTNANNEKDAREVSNRAVNERALAYQQRSRLNTVKTPMFASSPDLNKVNNENAISSSNARTAVATAKSGSAYFENPKNARSVAFSGISNAFQTLAQMPLQTADIATNIQMQPKTILANNCYNQHNSSVKDSAYGSTEVHENSTQQNIIQMNGKYQQPKEIRQQQVYRGALSMKDTPYDHVVVKSSMKKHR